MAVNLLVFKNRSTVYIVFVGHFYQELSMKSTKMFHVTLLNVVRDFAMVSDKTD